MKTKLILRSAMVVFSLGTPLVALAQSVWDASARIQSFTQDRSLIALAAKGSVLSEQTAAAAAPEFTSAQWIDIKDYAYDQRVSFFAGLKGVEAKVDDQITELNAKRAAMDSETDTRDWDLAMKELEAARVNLASAGEDIRKATPQTWNPLKEKVGQAWTKTQEAYTKVKLSTTN